ncbi:hypothetical protein FB565_003112 [Actinoplanes lutulentus]|uniref:Uncharacterized protein n=1 Tax=Actinoplanes lutulentus TaxID=1287878 RepID=A0A327Z1U4_9ACTN|nr:hypothetical protein [Actinoplanes lutulentus]RAK26082.1 hypothetical protein B0I29_129118 [Actinoplanes lutulentus]
MNECPPRGFLDALLERMVMETRQAAQHREAAETFSAGRVDSAGGRTR